MQCEIGNNRMGQRVRVGANIAAVDGAVSRKKFLRRVSAGRVLSTQPVSEKAQQVVVEKKDGG